MLPSDIPADLPHTTVELFSEQATSLSEHVLSASEALHEGHADNMYKWTLQSKRLPGTGIDTFKKAPTFAEVQRMYEKFDSQLKQAAAEQRIRDEFGQKSSAASGGASTGGGRLGRLVSTAPQAPSGKPKGKGKSRGRSVGGLAALAPRKPAAAGGHMQGRSTSPVGSTASGPGTASRSSGFGSRAPSTRVGSCDPRAVTPKKDLPGDHVQLLIGVGRKGSMGRALRPVDLMAVLLGYGDPGREVSAALERKDSLSGLNEKAREEEFIELCLAGKAWNLPQIPDTRTAELVKHFASLKQEPKFVMPLQHQLAFNKKVVLEHATSGNWKAWQMSLTPDLQQTSETWDAKSARFGGVEGLSPDDLDLYTETWQDAAFGNGIMQLIADVTPESWSDFDAVSRLWLDSEMTLNLDELPSNLAAIVTPFTTVLLGVRAVLDPTPFSLGATPSDVHFLWPQKDTPELQTLGGTVKNSKLVLRQVTRHPVLAKCRLIWEQHGGAEASIGREWVDIHEALAPFSSKLGSGPSSGFDVEAQEAAIEAYCVARRDAVARLRPGATQATDRLVLAIMRQRWKVMESKPAAETTKQVEKMLDIVQKILGSDGLVTALRDRLSEGKAVEQASVLNSALSAQLNSFEQCRLLHDAIVQTSTIPRSEDQLQQMRSAIPLVMKCVGLLTEPADLEAVTNATEALSSLLRERNVITVECPSLRSHAEAMLRLVDLTRIWRCSLRRLAEDSTASVLAVALDSKDKLKGTLGRGVLAARDVDDELATSAREVCKVGSCLVLGSGGGQCAKGRSSPQPISRGRRQSLVIRFCGAGSNFGAASQRGFDSEHGFPWFEVLAPASSVEPVPGL